MKICRNLNTLDRSIRGVVGIVTLLLGLVGSIYVSDPILRVFLIIFGLLNLISFAFGWCAVYQIANISTYRDKENDER